MGENADPILNRLWTKVHAILKQYRRPPVVAKALPRLSLSCLSPEILAVKVAMELRSRRKYVCSFYAYIFFWGGGEGRKIFTAFYYRSLPLPCDKVWLSSVV